MAACRVSLESASSSETPLALDNAVEQADLRRGPDRAADYVEHHDRCERITAQRATRPIGSTARSRSANVRSRGLGRRSRALGVEVDHDVRDRQVNARARARPRHARASWSGPRGASRYDLVGAERRSASSMPGRVAFADLAVGVDPELAEPAEARVEPVRRLRAGRRPRPTSTSRGGSRGRADHEDVGRKPSLAVRIGFRSAVPPTVSFAITRMRFWRPSSCSTAASAPAAARNGLRVVRDHGRHEPPDDHGRERTEQDLRATIRANAPIVTSGDRPAASLRNTFSTSGTYSSGAKSDSAGRHRAKVTKATDCY